MSIDDTADTSRRRQYTALTGQTIFDYPFRIFDEADLVVYVDDVLQTLNASYTVAGVDDETGGQVVFLAAVTAGAEVIIHSETLIERTADYQQNGPWTSERLNEEFDRGVVVDQEQRHYLRRTLRTSILEDEIDALPEASLRAGKYLYFNADGEPVAASGAPSDPLTVLYQTGVATADQTVVNTTHAYTPGSNQLSVYVNGEKQVVDVDYTETDSDTITFLTPLLEGDRYELLTGEVRAITLLNPVKRREDFVMTEGQTAIVLSTSTYVPGNNEIEVFMNGALLIPNQDYLETNSTTITLQSTAVAQEDDEIAVIIGQAYDPQIEISDVRYAISDNEVAAGITPSDITKPHGNVFRYGCVNDGVQVDTPSFTAALTAHPGSFYVPYTGTPYILGKLTIPSRTRGVVEPGVELRDSGSLLSTESFINVSGSDVDLTLTGVTINQNDNYAASSGSRHGIYITGSTVTIRGGTVTNCDIDGVNIAGGSVIRLYSVLASGNRRDGFRITTGRGVLLEDCRAVSQEGIETQSGFSIYPANSNGYLENIRLVRPVTRANKGAGVLVSLENWDAADREIDIVVDTPYCYGDGATVGSTADLLGGVTLRNARMGSLATTRGSVRVSSPVVIDSHSCSVHIAAWDTAGPRAEIHDLKVFNPNQSDDATATFGSAVSFTSNTAYTTSPGNVHFYRPVVYDTDGNLVANNGYAFRFSAPTYAWRNITLEDIYSSSGNLIDFDDDEVSVDSKITHAIPPVTTLTAAATTLDVRQHGRIFDNLAQAATREADLPGLETEMAGLGLELEFQVKANQYITLDPNGTEQIQPGSTGAGKYLRSNQVGASIRIRALNASTWRIVNQIGTWSFEP